MNTQSFSQNSEKRKILIIEDDSPFRTLLSQIFETENYEVRVAENGLVGKTILSLNLNQFDIVLCDVRMPELDGIMLLKDSRSSNSKTKFIMMTGYSEILDAEHAIELGADEFLSKPFKMSELMGAINKVLKSSDSTSEATPSDEDEFSFCKIHVDEFTTASTLLSDIYIRLADDRFVKVAREGAVIQVERIQTYKDKKVEYFYVLNRDFQKYAGFTLRIAKAAIKSKAISREKKIKLFKHTSEALLTQLYISDLNKEDIEASQNILGNTLNLIGDEPEIFHLVEFLKGNTNYTHNVAVSVYSCLIGKKVGWSRQQTLLKLSLGGLLHDIGKKEIPFRILQKSRFEMTPDEIAIYESHPQRGRELLSSIPGFPSDISLIAYQHHENNLGTGYPLSLSQKYIFNLAKIVHVADEFFTSCQKYSTEDSQPWKLALKELWEQRSSELEPAFLKALMELFSYPVPGPLLKAKLPG